MKGTNAFKQVMRDYLEKRGANDPLLGRIIMKPGKNMDDCITYIINQVKAMAKGEQEYGCTDDEVYSMAIHYFSEDVIDIGKPMNNVNVVVNRKVELTEEEKKQAHDIAMKEEIEKARAKILGKDKKQEDKKPATEKKEEIVKSLFND